MAHTWAMKNPVEEILAPVRQKAIDANAPLLERIGVTPEQLEPLVTPGDLMSRPLGRAAAKAALLGATRF
jgi:hypothetical protein